MISKPLRYAIASSIITLAMYANEDTFLDLYIQFYIKSRVIILQHFATN